MVSIYVKMIEKGYTSTGNNITFSIIENNIRKKYKKDIADDLIKQIKTQLINDGFSKLIHE